MAIVVKDRVKVTTATTGTGTLTLGSAETDFQAFSVIGDGNQTYYAIKSDAGFEVGIGTYTHSGSTLSRDTILESSNSGSAVSLTGTSTVFTTYPAERASFSDQGLSKTFTADGAITAGKPTILTSAGKAKQIAEEGNTVTEGFGTTSNFASSNINYTAPTIAQIGTNKVAFAYRDDSNSNYATVQIGEVNGSTNEITWGSKTVVDSNSIALSGVAYDTNTSTLAVLYGTTSWAEIKGATVSGTTPTFGSSKSLSAFGANKGWALQYDPDNQKITAFLTGVSGGTNRLRCYDITVNGTATPTENYYSEDGSLNAWWADSNYIASVYDTNTNVWLLTNGYDSSTTSRYFVVTNDGSAFTRNEVTQTLANYGGNANIAFDSTNNKVVLAYKNSSGTINVLNLTMSATSFTAGSVTTTTLANGGSFVWASYDPSGQRAVIFSGKAGDAGGNYGVYSNDGTTLTEVSTGNFGSTTQTYWAQRGGVLQTAMTDLSNNPIVLAMGTGGSDSFAGAFSVAQTPVTNLDNNYLGVASTTASDTEEVKINLPEGSINNSQSSLTIGNDYFSDTSGNVREFVDSGSALTSGQYLGRAISTTALKLKETPTDIIFGKASNTIAKGDPVLVEADGDFAKVTSDLTTENFIGIAQNAVSANEISKVKVVGIDDNQTGLTAGQLYYVKNDGTLSTTAESGKTVEAGKAISATKLLVKG